MRVISGKYKGKRLDGFDIDGTRPTMDRIKESLFGMIQNSIKDSVCLDLFAGSGSLGIEAISNGAKKVYFVDNGKEALKILKRNLVGIESYELLELDYMKALGIFKETNTKFDLIFLDPPYHKHYINNILDYVVKNNLFNTNGQVICEYEDELIQGETLELIKDKKYGDKSIRIYKKI